MLTKVIDQNNVERVAKLLERTERVVITAHVGPDGDALGSSLGLWHYLTALEKEATVILPNAFPDFLKWMPGSHEVLIYDSRDRAAAERCIAEAEVIFCLDYNELRRTDCMAPALEAAKAKKVLVDHHLNPAPFCDITISHPSISSASELVFRLICRMGDFSAITREGAECIYTGMMTDTGAFTYNSNNREIYFIIGELLTKGIDKDAIYRRVFNTYSESRLRLQGHILSHMEVHPEYHAALITLTDEEMRHFHYIKGDSEGFVNIPLSIKEVKFSCFLREDLQKKMIKVSLRSVGSFPCNKLAAEFFGGGGHLNASGGEFYGTMEEAKLTFDKALEAYKELLQSEE